VNSRVMFDTGALIALERRHQRICKIHRMAVESGLDVVAPTPVIAEWWRAGRGEKERRRLLRTFLQEPPDGHVARLAGSAIGRVGASVVDALVVAAASIRGDTVYTSDLDDLERLLEIFPDVRVEPV
jgi:predicted nucleic acid-binding protein